MISLGQRKRIDFEGDLGLVEFGTKGFRQGWGMKGKNPTGREYWSWWVLGG